MTRRRMFPRRLRVGAAGLVFPLAFVWACTATPPPDSSARREEPVAAAAAATPESEAELPQIVVLGDSLTAGYGLATGEDFPSQLQARLDESGYRFRVVNMGVSGDTSAGGLRRLDWSLNGDVAILVVALGGNDGLRGLPPPQMEQNLRTIVEGAEQRGARVLLCGMEAPPNLGDEYTRAFRSVFSSLAREKHLTLVPFLLEGVAGVPDLNQGDGIHPNAEGARRVAGVVWRYLEPMLKDRGTQ